MNIGRLFILNWRKLLILFFAEVAAILLHNFIYGLFGVEDALFFILAVIVLPTYFILALPVTLFYLLTRLTKKKPKKKKVH